MGFALAGAVALVMDTGIVGSILCIAGIQLRLLCNLFDGMVAIEGGKKSDVGSLYNEFPDRIADSLLIVAAPKNTFKPTQFSFWADSRARFGV